MTRIIKRVEFELWAFQTVFHPLPLDPHYQAYLSFFRRDDFDEVKKILAERPSELLVVNSELRTPVHESAALDRSEILRCCLEDHESKFLSTLSIKDSTGMTPLELGVKNDATGCVSLILRAAKIHPDIVLGKFVQSPKFVQLHQDSSVVILAAVVAQR